MPEGGRQRGGIREIGCSLDLRRQSHLGANAEHVADERVGRIRPHTWRLDGHDQFDVAAERALQFVLEAPVVLSRKRPDVDADFGPVRHRVDVEPPVHEADVERRCPHHGVSCNIEAEVLELRDGRRRLVDRVDALIGHRAVRRHALRHGLRPERALVPAQRPVARRFRHDQGTRRTFDAAFRQQRGTGDADLLARRDVQDHAGRAGELRRHADRRCRDRRGTALHVGGAAPPQFPVLDEPAVRRHRPRLQPERDGVRVPGEGERLLVRRTADPRDEVRTPRLERDKLAGEARGFQLPLEMIGTRTFVARRVDGVEADQLGGKFDGA